MVFFCSPYPKHVNTGIHIKSESLDVDGRPDVLFFLPESNGGESNLIVPVQDDKMVYARNHIVETETTHDHFSYIGYVMDSQQFSKPVNWREALDLFENVLIIARTGYTS